MAYVADYLQSNPQVSVTLGELLSDDAFSAEYDRRVLGVLSEYGVSPATKNPILPR